MAPATSRARVAAKKAVELSQVPGKATDLEKLYIAAVAARRDPDAKDPEEAFVKGMRELLAAHPDEVEAQLDLALMIMRGFTLPDKKPVAPGSTEAVAILRGLLPKRPTIRGCTTTSSTASKARRSPRMRGRAARNTRNW